MSTGAPRSDRMARRRSRKTRRRDAQLSPAERVRSRTQRTNPAGAKARHVQEAVSELQRVGSPGAYFAAAEVAARARGWRYGVLQQWPSTLRLAMEMAAHEEVERERIASELAHLERAWREAELIAAVADRLALPAPPESGGAGQLRRANTPAR